MDDLYAILDKGHPVIICFDCDRETGDPVVADGRFAHTGVVTGYFDRDGERFVVAKHSQSKSASAYAWRAEVLSASMQGVKKCWRANMLIAPAVLQHLVWCEDKGLVIDPSVRGDFATLQARLPPGHLQLSGDHWVLCEGAALGIQRSLGNTLVEIVPADHELSNSALPCKCPSRSNFVVPKAAATPRPAKILGALPLPGKVPLPPPLPPPPASAPPPPPSWKQVRHLGP